MVSALLIAGVVGIGLGVFLQKGRFCFVHAFRDLFAFKDTRVTKGVLAATILTMVFWSIAYELGFYQSFWVPGWGFTGLVGGFIFGVGMTYAGGCASGTLYRAGQGYLHFWLTLAFMGVGYAAFTIAYPTLEAAYFEPLTIGEGLTLFRTSPVPAPVLALGIAAVVVVGFTFEDFSAAADLRHLRGFGIPTHHPEATVAIEHRAQHHAVTVLKNMQWQHFLGEEHHIWQREKRKLPYGQFCHGDGRTGAILRSIQGLRAS